jgi:hypothetical protein
VISRDIERKRKASKRERKAVAYGRKSYGFLPAVKE